MLILWKLALKGVRESDSASHFSAADWFESSVTRAALRSLPPLISSFDGLKTILNLTGVAAHFVGTEFCAYQTSRHSVLRLSELFVTGYGDSKGILSYGVHSGAIATDMASHLPEESERRDWLAGRYISAQWDVDELMSKKGTRLSLATNRRLEW
ncbi:uncharacterized protein C8R40DRAFT_1173204 [Lentinula edodes]|uniref:uncharacterized protein n=1 Tax=Lentinula edodes TaxID=5353 RepID=UPI001E8D2545|nr:uncharacterized protein C8R40DRAFT_1173204 [Lentinula edodes]KAH7872805.1 hypothetical protein C8R40DRAFT_1173204 [Lentinula edodes]